MISSSPWLKTSYSHGLVVLGTSTDMTTRLQPVVVMEERGSDSTLESDVITTNGYDEYQVPTARRFSSMPTSIRGKERIYDIPTLLNIGSRVVSSDTRKREVHSGANLGKKVPLHAF